MKNGWKRTLTGMVVFLLLCIQSTFVYAHEVPDLTRSGSITVGMRYEGKEVPGGTLMIYRVGEVCENDGNYSFGWYGAFAGCGYSLESMETQALADQLVNYAETRNIQGTVADISQNGMAVFQGLDLGVYLVVQTEAAESYEKISPFLITIPMTEDGKYTYNVDASPKLELTRTYAPSITPEPSADKPSGSRLPKTGQLNWPIPILASAGVLLFAVGWMLKYGKRKKYHAV